MAKVSNITITRESNTDTYFARWDFNEEKKSVAAPSTSIRAGTIVKIKSGAKYYNGVTVPSAVQSRPGFKVKSISGNRAVLGASTDGQYADINSPVHTQYLTIVSGGSTSGGSTTTTEYNKYLDHYEVEWHYHTGLKNKKDGSNVWFGGGSSDVKIKQSDSYSPPENATTIRVRVKPVSKTYKVKSGNTEVEKSHYTGESAYQWFDMGFSPPQELAAPSIEKKGLSCTLKASIDSEQPNNVTIESVEFQVVDTLTGKVAFKRTPAVKLCEAVYTFTLKVGGTYKAKCRAVNNHRGSTIYGKWSDFTAEIKTAPAAVTTFKCSAYDEEQVKATWKTVPNATSYEIQYADKLAYFDMSDNVSSKKIELDSGTEGVYIFAVDPGKLHYFRIRAINEEGESGWSTPVSAAVGSKPEKPTTWSLSNTAMAGEDITLYWVHNSEDGSKMSEANIRLVVDGVTQPLINITGTTDDTEENPIHSYEFDTSAYGDGAKMSWQVQTKGVVAEWSDWSIAREIEIFAPPTVSVMVNTTTIEETVTSEDGTEGTIIKEILATYPLILDISAGPERQTPISYHISVTNKNAYETVDDKGSDTYVAANTSVYAQTIVTSESELHLELTAGDIHLENGQMYTVTATVAMDSGLTGTDTAELLTSWDAYTYEPDASIGIDDATLTAYITPYCMNADENLSEDVTLAVYRREYNGLFTTIATGVPNNGIETVVDPHPALDYARYRIVATHSTTGSISYEDLPAHPVNIHDIVIQWDEAWSNFDYTEDAPAETPPWTGSMLRFPYNIDVTETYSPDVSLVNYVGREHPVSYFGTHRGETATWNTVIPATDKETVYGLRRLAAYRGNVYVREPSGTGYWAYVKVSFPQKHKDLTIAVTFNITRVEGGI